MKSFNVFKDQILELNQDDTKEYGVDFFKSYQLIQHVNNNNINIKFTREGQPLRANIALINSSQYPFIMDHLADILHIEELSYFNNLQIEKRRKEYLLAHYAAKIVAGAYIGENEFSQIEIASGYFRQPIVKYKVSDIPEISLSHCVDMAVAISCEGGHLIGIDIEKVDFTKTKILKGQLTETELEWVQNQNIENYVLYNQIWTIKESLSKAIKCGLTVPFNILEIDKQEYQDGFLCCEFKNFGQYKCYNWIIDDYAMSITVPKKTDISIDIKEIKERLNS